MNLAARLRDMPVRRKLMFIAFVSAGAALLFAMALLTVRQWVEARSEMVLGMGTHAGIISINSTSAILFGDQRAAAETMGALAAVKEVEFAEIRDKDGRMFASYVRPGAALSPRQAIPAGAQYFFSATHLDLFRPILSEGVPIGTIHINASLARLYAEIFQNVAFLLAVTLGGLAVAWMLTSRLHHIITGPVAGLIGLMDRVSIEKNYALRALPGGKDDLGKLVDEFNGMLEQIQARDEMLAKHREQLEQEVVLRTARLVEAQRIAHIGNWEWDIVGNTLVWSDEIYRIFGLAPQQFGATYEAFLQATHPDDRGLVDACVREAIGQRRPYSIDHRILLPDGAERYVHEQAEVNLGADGQPVSMLGTVQDITERRQAEDRIRESEARFRGIFEYADDIIYLLEPDGTFRSLSPAFGRITGWSVEEWVGKPFAPIIHPDDLPYANEVFARTLSGESAPSFRLRIARKSGEYFDADLSITPLGGDGVTGALGIARDITQRKLAEEAVEQIRRQMELILEAAGEGICTIDMNGNHVLVNPSAARMFGYEVADMIGRNSHTLWHYARADGAPYPVNECLIHATLRDGVIRRSDGEVFWRKDGTSFPVEYVSTPIQNNGAITGTVVVFHDITERKLAEEKISRMNEELEIKVQERTRQLLAAQEELVRKEKLAVLGQVAGSVGHELRNPLGVMSNAVYFLQTVLSDADETTREYLGIIKNEISASERIVSDLLDSVRIKPPRPEAVSVEELIGQTLGKLAIPPNVTVRLDIPQAIPPLRVDAMQIHQVIRNLISNGVEAMPDGGELEIRAAANETEKNMTVSVRDTGIGIAPEQMARLFLPLYTTKARGIGLGLVVVKNLTEANGGRVEVRSEQGKGTTFSITLPCDGATIETG